jgi:hypothetical protein
MPSYWTGISHPAKGTSRAPAATWRSCSGLRRSAVSAAEDTCPRLLQSAGIAVARLTVYGSAVITFRSSTTKESLFVYTLTDVRVADDHQVFEATRDEPTGTLKELVTLTYTKMHWEAANTPVRTRRGWDFSQNTPF